MGSSRLASFLGVAQRNPCPAAIFAHDSLPNPRLFACSNPLGDIEPTGRPPASWHVQRSTCQDCFGLSQAAISPTSFTRMSSRLYNREGSGKPLKEVDSSRFVSSFCGWSATRLRSTQDLERSLSFLFVTSVAALLQMLVFIIGKGIT